MPVRGSARGA
ncbi:hypothetical protein STRIP9103_00706, partial [Streptomyces ipomoeae 91-03]